jgi:orotidine-5'-phosphate decarboxylase
MSFYNHDHVQQIDKLMADIIKLKSPIVVGLDPVINRIPKVYFDAHANEVDDFKKISKVIIDFNRDIIDSVAEIVPAVKPQMAFYEMYGSQGIIAFEETIRYAKKKGLLVIEDGKRNDIGNTALAYAQGHLGKVQIDGQREKKNFDVDFLTVSSYLGKESIEPFIEVCKQYDKGIFVLVKTSNLGNEEIQNVVDKNGDTVSEMLAKYLHESAEDFYGTYGYSSIGAVIGATYPSEAEKLRKIMKRNLFLVPGYGTQGGSAKSIVKCFNEDGLGALINASRSINYAFEAIYNVENCSKEAYRDTVRQATLTMKEEIYHELKKEYKQMSY